MSEAQAWDVEPCLVCWEPRYRCEDHVCDGGKVTMVELICAGKSPEEQRAVAERLWQSQQNKIEVTQAEIKAWIEKEEAASQLRQQQEFEARCDAFLQDQNRLRNVFLGWKNDLNKSYDDPPMQACGNCSYFHSGGVTCNEVTAQSGHEGFRFPTKEHPDEWKPMDNHPQYQKLYWEFKETQGGGPPRATRPPHRGRAGYPPSGRGYYRGGYSSQHYQGSYRGSNTWTRPNAIPARSYGVAQPYASVTPQQFSFGGATQQWPDTGHVHQPVQQAQPAMAPYSYGGTPHASSWQTPRPQ